MISKKLELELLSQILCWRLIRERERSSLYHEKAYEFFKLSYVTNDRPIFTKEKTTWVSIWVVTMSKES